MTTTPRPTPSPDPPPGADVRDAQGVQVVLPGGSGVQYNYFAGRRPVPWPHQIGVLPLRADGFQHRVVDETLDRQAGPGVSDALPQVIRGIGGVGKSQLAAEFARRLWSAGELDLLLWVSVTSRESVLTAYAQAATDLMLGPEADNPINAARRFLAWLSSTDRRWLIVLDDLADAGAVRDLWPPNWTSGRTLVTTRRHDATLLAGRSLVEVDVFSLEEATSYLVRKLPVRLANDVDGVADDLGRLPLALGQAAAYMIDQDLTCGTYRERFAQQHQRLAELLPEESALFDSGVTVASTWALSVNAADDAAPRGLAKPLLAVAAMLNSGGIPETVFTASSVRGFAGENLSVNDVRDGLRCLHRFNLVTYDAARVQIHALVQRTVRDDLPREAAVAAARAAASSLDSVWHDADPGFEQAQLMRSNASAVFRHQPGALWDGGVHPVLLRLANSYGDAALVDTAIDFTRALIADAAAHLAPDHSDLFTMRVNLAWWLGDAGHLDEAIRLLDAVVKEAVRLLGKSDPHTLDALQKLGYQCGQAGDPTRATQVLREVYDDRCRLIGADDPLTLVTGDQLGYWLTVAGEVDAAISLLEDLLPRAARALGPRRRETLSIRGTLASAWGSAGEPVRAAAALRDLIVEQTQVLGAEHREVWVSRANEAYWQWQAGDLLGAAAAMELVLADRIRMFGDHHRDTLAARDNLAVLHGLLGDHTRAATELETVLADRSRVLGHDHPETLDTQYGVALLHAELGDTAVAIAELKQVLAEQERVLGAEHPATNRSRNALAKWHAPDQD